MQRTKAEIQADLDRLGRNIDALQARVLRAMCPVDRRAYERRIAEREARGRVRVK